MRLHPGCVLIIQSASDDLASPVPCGCISFNTDRPFAPVVFDAVRAPFAVGTVLLMDTSQPDAHHPQSAFGAEHPFSTLSAAFDLGEL